MSTANDGIYIIDRFGVLVEANDDFFRMLGYDRDDMADLNVSDWSPSWNPIAILGQISGIRKNVMVIESTHRRKDGASLNVEMCIACVPSGDCEYLCIAIRDITERKRVEQELRIAAIAFEAHYAMAITDADSNILRVNQALVELSGYAAEKLIGSSPKILHSDFHDENFYSNIWREIETCGYWRGEMMAQRDDGELYPAWCTVTAVIGGDGAVSNYVITLTDISQRKCAEKEIRELAYYDPLTKLGNRRLLLDRLQQALQRAEINSSRGALFFIDLDNFKKINETAGHEIGDKLLQHVAMRLLNCVRDGDTVARLGGDEFVVVLADIGQQNEHPSAMTEQVGNRILAALNAPYDLAGYVHHSSPSIGVTLFGAERETVGELLRRADLAMYQAKADGKNAMRYFDPQMQNAVTAWSELEEAVRSGLRHNEFSLYYQPQVTHGGQLMGVEALLRWCHPKRGWLAPSEFIPVAEESGLIIPLGLYALEAACRQLVEWEENCDIADFTMSVNVSARQFRQSNFVEQILTTLKNTGANPSQLMLELTESMLVDDVDDTIKKITALKAHGVGFALDDFGTGYSSLSYLKRLPLDQLKIDRSFVDELLDNQSDAAIAQMIVQLGRSLNLTVVAEGVETERQRNILSGYGCHAYQGYLFGRPMAAESFKEFATKQGHRLS